MRHLLKTLRCQKGYTLLVVLCVMLLFTVMGTNALVAAYARTGTIAQKKIDAQAYALSSSLLTCVGEWITQGSFDQAIQTGLIDGVTTAEQAQGKEITLTAALPLNDAKQVANLTLGMTLDQVQIKEVPDAAGVPQKQVSAQLVVQVTAEYEKSQYSFLADFIQVSRVDEAGKTVFGWLLHGYRTDRILGEETT